MRILLNLFYAGILGTCLLAGGLFFALNHVWVDFSILEHYNPGDASIVYDCTGQEWTRFQIDKRELVSYHNISPYIVKAFIAAEDWNFFSHHGISYKGIIRSTLINIYHNKRSQGASTITQQLVKLLFFDAQKNFTRKLKEQFLALIVERQFTKEKILETYLNHVYFGAGIYGIEAACQRFWGKSCSTVTIDEAAILASIIRNPKYYCPLFNPLNTEQRRNIVLYNMKKLRFIAQEEYEQAKHNPLELISSQVEPQAPHLRESLRIFLEDLVGKKKLYTGGLRIQTTLNRTAQDVAERVFKNSLTKLKKSLVPDIDGALVSIEGKTGAIRVLIGGYSFQQSQFNRAMQAKRQFGSTLKPLIYAGAIARGFSFADTALDEPFVLDDNGAQWAPKNYNHQFNGQITLASALSRSNNIVTIKTFLETGLRAMSLFTRCNLKDISFYPSLALGCVDGTVCQAAGLFNVFAHEGQYHEPYFVEWVKDKWGTKLYKHTPIQHQVMHPIVSSQVGKVLTLSLERTKKRMGSTWIDCQVMGKTGTTNDSRTCWFTGSTPDITTSIYLGCDDNKSLGKNVFPTRTAFPIWLALTQYMGSEKKEFSFDPTLTTATIHEKTGIPIDQNHPDAITILVDKMAIARKWYKDQPTKHITFNPYF